MGNSIRKTPNAGKEAVPKERMKFQIIQPNPSHRSLGAKLLYERSCRRSMDFKKKSKSSKFFRLAAIVLVVTLAYMLRATIDTINKPCTLGGEIIPCHIFRLMWATKSAYEDIRLITKVLFFPIKILNWINQIHTVFQKQYIILIDTMKIFTKNIYNFLQERADSTEEVFARFKSFMRFLASIDIESFLEIIRGFVEIILEKVSEYFRSSPPKCEIERHYRDNPDAKRFRQALLKRSCKKAKRFWRKLQKIYHPDKAFKMFPNCSENQIAETILKINSHMRPCF